jgi:hypothetical protein
MATGLSTPTRPVNVPGVTEPGGAAGSSAADVRGSPLGIIPGPAFVPTSNCSNCGKPINGVGRWEECENQ